MSLHSPVSHSRSKQSGFTLVEMSIVLTIIALLVGGVLAGQNMIRSANMQETTAHVEQYRSAVMKFSDRFLELPGDFQSATSNWSGSGVANGNGNGRIGGDDAVAPSLNNDCTASNWAEQWNVWVQLSKAGLIPGEFTSPGNVSTITIGTNVPGSSIRGGGYTLRFCGDITSSTSYFNGTYGHTMQIGSGASSVGGTRKGLFTPKEAAAIDGKFDDGYPHTGKVLAPKLSDGYAPNCSNSDTNAPVTADYLFSQTSTTCPLFFLLGF